MQVSVISKHRCFRMVIFWSPSKVSYCLCIFDWILYATGTGWCHLGICLPSTNLAIHLTSLCRRKMSISALWLNGKHFRILYYEHYDISDAYFKNSINWVLEEWCCVDYKYTQVPRIKVGYIVFLVKFFLLLQIVMFVLH